MSKDGLRIISDAMESFGLNYGFLGDGIEYDEEGNPIYPYFTGEYQELPPTDESGLQETTFLLTGFSRGSFLALEDAKEAISTYFPKVDGRIVNTDNGSVVAIFYSDGLAIPIEEAELKKIQINLDVKEWSVK